MERGWVWVHRHCLLAFWTWRAFYIELLHSGADQSDHCKNWKPSLHPVSIKYICRFSCRALEYQSKWLGFEVTSWRHETKSWDAFPRWTGSPFQFQYQNDYWDLMFCSPGRERVSLAPPQTLSARFLDMTRLLELLHSEADQSDHCTNCKNCSFSPIEIHCIERIFDVIKFSIVCSRPPLLIRACEIAIIITAWPHPPWRNFLSLVFEVV